MKTTIYENKIARVTFTKNDKRVIEIFPNDLFVPKDCDDQCLFTCSLIELKKSSITLHINEFKEKTTINEIFQDETALEYFKDEGMAVKTNKGWKLNTSFEEADKFIKSHQPLSGPSEPLNQPATAEPISQTAAKTTPINTPSDMETPSDKIIPNSTKPESGSQGINTKDLPQHCYTNF